MYKRQDLTYLNSKDKYGDTPMHKAAFYRRTAIFKAFLSSKNIIPDLLKIKSNYNETPLGIAVLLKNTVIIEAFLASPNINDEDKTSFKNAHPSFN